MKAQDCCQLRSLRFIMWKDSCTKTNLWEDFVSDNIDEEYERLVEHLNDSARKAKSLKALPPVISASKQTVNGFPLRNF
uniref:Uncharacterized protein n=1 Tax=Haemonchus contortus TaxID=6289 RepID=W6NHM3_HAECO